MKTKILLLCILLCCVKAQSQCINDLSNIHTYVWNNTQYEIVKEKKTWGDAAACAVSRGGGLVEIDSQAEQDTLWHHLSMAGITYSNTVAPDGAGSYVWLGGHDQDVEGSWFWDGMDIGTFNQFWQGDYNGSPVNGAYTNWGNEPDDAGGQDGLGLSLNGWPLGVAGQWNDVDVSNPLYFVIELPWTATGIAAPQQKHVLRIYPNPSEGSVHLDMDAAAIGSAYSVVNSLGQEVLQGKIQSSKQTIDIGQLPSGIYVLSLEQAPGECYRLLKQ